jgi:hypothetical protein
MTKNMQESVIVIAVTHGDFSGEGDATGIIHYWHTPMSPEAISCIN